MRSNKHPMILTITLAFLLAILSLLGTVGVVQAETYEVQPGETLLEIAETLGIDPMLISLSNNISDPRDLRAGQILVVPDPSRFTLSVKGTMLPVCAKDGVGEWVVPFDAPSGVVSTLLTYDRFESAPRGVFGALDLGMHLCKLPLQHPAYVWPAFGQIATYYGEKDSVLWRRGYHEGVDISAREGSLVRAADDGVVEVAGADTDRGFGNMIKLHHGRGEYTLYGHLSRVCVWPGQQVARGQVIGLVGNTGVSTGSHLHFSVIVNDQYVDPLPYLP